MLTRCARNCRQVGIERGRVGSGEKRKKDVKSQKNRKQYEKRKRKSKSTQAAVKPEAPLSFPDHISSVGVGQSSMREDVVMADENQELKSGDGAPLCQSLPAAHAEGMFIITNFPLFRCPLLHTCTPVVLPL
mmetsp:Transcript_13216/g.19780  ORF Transcript_13216/g.19780 Transcript_13216/m.19780 type:complete len:132 (-) Transcript_13216:1-396(-)